VTFLAELKKFTIKELEEYNGKDGKPTYVAFQDKVYDFSQSSRWYGGDHMNRHHAGKDLTKELKMSHHGKKVLERASVKLVGRLV
jgi:predicted heme/steroid binding protein